MLEKFLRRIVQYFSLLSFKQNNLYNNTRLQKLASQSLSHYKPYMDTTVSHSCSHELRLKAHKVCSDHLGGTWAKITPAELTLVPISGGMSNALYCCTLPNSSLRSKDEPKQVLLRLYGDQWTNVDMTLQIQIFNLLSNKKLGPKFYGDFEGGRLEEFLQADPLTCKELRNKEISSIIAEKLAAVHSLNVNIDKTDVWLQEKCNEWLNFIDERRGRLNPRQDMRRSTRKIAQELLSIDFNKEIYFLCSILDNTCSPLVFSHNDLHQGNILLAKYTSRRSSLEERIVFIDFEYCSYNYRAYDIANHFTEWCFKYDTPDYPHFAFSEDRFPPVEMQRNFIRHYIERQKEISARSKSRIINTKKGLINAKTFAMDDANNNNTNNRYSDDDYDDDCDMDSLSDPHEASDNRMSKEDLLLEEVRPFFMAANLLWTIWCIKSALTSNIKFGYWEHALVRWTLYSKFKSHHLNPVPKNKLKGVMVNWEHQELRAEHS